ncbi:MAG: tetratricopeptide repeat protein [Ekhidna sp.]|nr:tetratricopeptide repeat protein [Ekhidna sp.]
MRLIFVTLALAFWIHSLAAQQRTEIDSLENLLKTIDSPKKRLEIYVKLAETLRVSDSLNTLKYVKEAITLARKIDYPEREVDALYHQGVMLYFRSHFETSKSVFEDVVTKSEECNYLVRKADALNVMGIIANYQGDSFLSIDYYEQSLYIQEELGNQKGVANAVNNMGVIYEKIGHFGKALDCLYRYLDLSEQLDNQRGMSTAYNNIGIIHKQVNDFQKALKVFEKSIAIKEGLNDIRGIAETNNNIGGVYLDQDRPEEAKPYFLKALDIFSGLDDIAGMIASYDNLGGIYTQTGDHDTAIKYFEKSLKMNEVRGTGGDKSYPLTGLGSIELKRGDYTKAANYFRLSLQLAAQNSAAKNIEKSSLKLAEAEAAAGNYKEAYQAFLQFQQVNDSINNIEQVQQIARIEAEHEFEQERDSIQFVNERERIQLETALDQRKWQQKVMFVGLSISILFIILITFFYHKLKRLNIEVMNQRDRLANMNKTKNKFFSIIAHDLRGPMSVIAGIQYLLEDYISKKNIRREDDLHSISHMLEESSDRAHHLMDSLLTWAIKEQEGIPYNPLLLNVMGCIDETIATLLPQAKNKSIELAKEGDPEVNGYLDKNTFLTILRNLTGNAIKFTPEGGKIILGVSQTDAELFVFVSDSGTGIAEEKLDSLFSLNMDHSSKGTKGEKGTGLGLNIVYDFVKMNKGKISVESEEGKGTTFKMSFNSE